MLPTVTQDTIVNVREQMGRSLEWVYDAEDMMQVEQPALHGAMQAQSKLVWEMFQECDEENYEEFLYNNIGWAFLAVYKALRQQGESDKLREMFDE